MKSILEKIKNDKRIILSFFLPIFIFSVYFFIYKIHYKDFFVADLHEQYSNFFYYLKDVMNGDASIFYSFYKGLGGSMLGTFIYYLSSPLNLLLFFVPKNHIQMFMVMLIFFKIGLSSQTMYLYLKNHFKEKVNLIFPLCYSLSGYVIIYYFNIMWLDVVYLAPLVILGIDELLEKNNVKYYMIFLFLSIISNIYISFMLCIFCVIYFFYEYLLLEIKDRKKVILFFKSSFLTGLLCSFMIIPFIIELSNVYRVAKGMPNSISIILRSFFEMFSSFFLNVPNKQMVYWNSNLYFSIFMFILVILYFFNKNISKRNKKISLIFIMIFTLSYSVPFINYIWHGFSVPVILNYRYSFLVTFFLILLSYKSFKNIKVLSQEDVIYSGLFVCFIYILSSLYLEKINNLFIINLFFIISYILFININRKYQNKYYALGLSVIVIIDLFINMKTTFITNKNLEEPYIVYDEKFGLCEKLEKVKSFRSEGYIFNTNENLICKNGRISEFNTMNDKNIRFTLEKLGADIFHTDLSNHEETSKLLNSILGIEYIYSNQDLNVLYQEIDLFNVNEKKYYLYKNNHLNIGFMFRENDYSKKNKNNFEYQNTFIKYLTDISTYNAYEITKINKNIFEINIDNRYPIYLNYQNRYDMDVYINNKKIEIQKYKYGTQAYKSGNIYIPNHYENQIITLKINTKEDINEKELLVYYLDMDRYNEVMEKLSKEQLENIKIDKNKLTGEIEVKENKTLFLSIPYNKNFNIYIDGKKTKYRKLYDTFLGVDLNEGKHMIKIIYFPTYIYYGFIVSGITLIYLIHKLYKIT